MAVILGIIFVLVAIFAIVGNISNSRQFGGKIISNKLFFYVLLLFVGIALILTIV